MPTILAPVPAVEASLRDAGTNETLETRADAGESSPDAARAEAEDNDDAAGTEGSDEEVAEEAEPHELSDGGEVRIRYTADLSDEELRALWKSAPEKLGCMSFGFADEGRLLNAERFPASPDWTVVSPEAAWATPEAIQFVSAAIREVRRRHPDAPPLRVNQFSAREGGYLRPHKSHQNGRDVDLAFYYPGPDPIRVREREKHIDVPLNWELVKALVTLTDVQVILMDRRVQKVLYDHALRTGEDKAWLDSIFRAPRPLVQHARRHRDHLHVRFFAPRSQELGRRVTPLLAERPDQNLALHRVKRGDTLGAIARRYGSSVEALRKANRISGSLLRISQVLKVPLRGPCTRCPVPPAPVVPPRRLPPAPVASG